jgi:ATP-dependent DNA helicase RecG
MERLSDDELLALLADTESDRAERKEAATDGDKIRQAVCAFANDMPNHRRPGVVFVNAKDDGTPAKTPITDQLLLSLSSMKSDGNILPIPTMTVEKRTLDGHDYAVVTVMPADAPPVRFKGTTWIRVGPRRHTASLQYERVLNERRRFRDLPFDLQPIPSSTVADLQARIFGSLSKVGLHGSA